MGINKVYEMLVDMDKNLPGGWFSSQQIRERLTRKGESESNVKKTTGHLLKLAMFNMVQMKGEGLVHHIKLFKIPKGK